MKPGTIVIINGTSSSGKTSIVKAFQDLATEPYLEMGIDKFLWMLPHRYLNTAQWSEVVTYKHNSDGNIIEVHATQYGNRVVSGMHRGIREMARQGINVIADHVFHEEGWVRECADLLHDLPAYLVGIRCPLEVLEERERTRKNRTLGQAKAQYDLVHAHCIYDFEVDTSVNSPEECALQIKAHLDSGAPPRAFMQLRERKKEVL
jgi:chloramphenicol 3-O phosphotransferase